MLTFSNSLIITFAFYTLAIWVGLLSNSTFNQLNHLAIWSLVFAVPVVAFVHMRQKVHDISGHLVPVLAISKAKPITAIAIIGLMAIVGGLTILSLDVYFVLSWLLMLAIGFLFVLPATWMLKPNEEQRSTRLIKRESLFLACVGLGLVFLYLMSNVSNADDTHFVSYIVGLLAEPNVPIFSVDKIFNSGLPNYIFALNYGQSWEALVATLSYFTGLDYLAFYYFYLPAVFLFLAPVPVFLFTKTFFPKYALVGTIFSLMVLILWSTYNHMHGFFFIPRMYQGKAIFLTFFLPFIFLYSRVFFQSPNVKSGLLLIACLIGSAGATSSGVYIGLLAMGMGFLAFSPLRLKTISKNALLFIVLSLPNLFMLTQVKQQISEVDQVISETRSSVNEEALSTANQLLPEFAVSQQIKETKRPIFSMYWLFGDNKYLLLFCLFLFSPLFFWLLNKQALDSQLLRFLIVVMVIGFAHPIATWLTKTIGPGNLVWRYHWAIPTALLSSVFAASVMSLAFPRWIKVGVVCVIPLGLALISVNHLKTKFEPSFQTIKIDREALNASQQLTQILTSNDRVLAVSDINQTLPMLLHDAELVISRPLYWHKPYFSGQQLKELKLMQYFIENGANLSERQMSWLLSKLIELNINHVIWKRSNILSLRDVWQCQALQSEYMWCHR